MSALLNHVEKYSRREKAAHEGYSIDDEGLYSMGMIRELMPLVYDRDNWTADGRPVDNNYTICLVDLANVVTGLNDRYCQALMLKCRDDMSTEEIGGVMGLTPFAASNMVAHALRRLRKRLGGPHPWSDPPEE